MRLFAERLISSAHGASRNINLQGAQEVGDEVVRNETCVRFSDAVVVFLVVGHRKYFFVDLLR